MVRNVQMWSVVTSVNARVVSRERIVTKVSFTQETRSKPITISLSRTLIKRLLYSTPFFFTDLIKAGLRDAPAGYSINDGPFLLFKKSFRHWNCFLSSVAMDVKDGREFKLEKVGPTFSSKYLQNKRVKLPQDCRVHRQHGRCIIVLEYQYGLLDVMWKRSIFQVIKEMVEIAPLHWLLFFKIV